MLPTCLSKGALKLCGDMLFGRVSFFCVVFSAASRHVASRHCEEERRSKPVDQPTNNCLDCFVPRNDVPRKDAKRERGRSPVTCRVEYLVFHRVSAKQTFCINKNPILFLSSLIFRFFAIHYRSCTALKHTACLNLKMKRMCGLGLHTSRETAET